MLKQQIDQDIKTALLSGDQDTANVLRGLKSAILYSEVSLNLRDEGLDDASIIKVLSAVHSYPKLNVPPTLFAFISKLNAKDCSKVVYIQIEFTICAFIVLIQTLSV